MLTTGQRAGEALAVVWPALRWHHASAGMPDLVLRAVASALEVGAHVEAALLLDFLAEVLPSLPPGLHETAAALRSRVAAAADTAARLADLRGATPEWRALGAMPRLRAAFAGADVAPDVARERRVAACRELRGALVDLRVRAQADPQAALAVNLALRRWLADASWQQALRPVYNADIRSEELDAAGREFITTWREMKVLRDQTAVVFAAAPR